MHTKYCLQTCTRLSLTYAFFCSDQAVISYRTMIQAAMAHTLKGVGLNSPQAAFAFWVSKEYHY